MKLKKIGLLGGTFNYAHSGHLYISSEAIKKLQLDEVWWLICKLNPLKNHECITRRLKYAKHFLGLYPKVKIFAVKEFSTYKLLLKLKHKFKENDYVWIMGMDNLINLHSWDNANDIMSLASIAIFNRDNLFYPALKSPFAIRNIKKFSGQYCQNHSWCTLCIKKNNDSSTKLGHRMR